LTLGVTAADPSKVPQPPQRQGPRGGHAAGSCWAEVGWEATIPPQLCLDEAADSFQMEVDSGSNFGTSELRRSAIFFPEAFLWVCRNRLTTLGV
jgi:hypothetical protein